VKFNGTGAVAINGSGNVSSITDNGTGNYTANFTTAITDTNFCCTASCKRGTDESEQIAMPVVYSTGSVRVVTRAGSNTLIDSNPVSVAVFR
jgi:hypothetical protein